MQMLTANLLSLLHFACIRIEKLFAFSMSVCVWCVYGGGRNGIPGIPENHKTLALKGDLQIIKQLLPSLIERQPRPREVM